MDSSNFSANKSQSLIEQSRNYHDIKGLDNLRQAARSGDKKALEEAAKQFEGIFVQMMLKSMRQAQDVLADEDSPFNSQQVKFYRQMHDQQLATDLTQRGSIGLAEVIVQQLGGQLEGYTPAGIARNDANLADINRKHAQQVASAQDSVLQSKRQEFATPQEFIQSLLPEAKKAAESLGIEPMALVAQAAVETGWGKHIMQSPKGQSSFNLFGIKADNRWTGDKTTVETLEYKQGIAQKQKAHFRAYDSFADSMQDYSSFVKNSPRYADAVQQADDPQAYFESLQKAGYATDPNYAKKVMSIMNSDTFARFLHNNE